MLVTDDGVPYIGAFIFLNKLENYVNKLINIHAASEFIEFSVCCETIRPRRNWLWN